MAYSLLTEFIFLTLMNRSISGIQNEFVSTNDVMNTWLYSLCPPIDGIQMVVDLRTRLPSLNENMAGNYIAICPINFFGIQNAKDYRDKLTAILSKERPADTVSKTGSTNGTANWMTLYHQVEIPGFSHRIHMPVFGISDFWEEWMGIPITFQCFSIIFRLNNEQVGIVIGTYNDVMTEEYFENCNLLEKKLVA